MNITNKRAPLAYDDPQVIKDKALKLKAFEKKHKAEEAIYRLVVKISSWKSGIVEGASVKSSDKISVSEWRRYQQHLLNISKSDTRVKIMQKLQQVREAIKANGGFE